MRRTRWWALLALMVMGWLMLPLTTLGQHTGGSFGGSRWGSGSAPSRPSTPSRPSYGGGGGSYGSRPSYGGGSGSYGGTTYGTSSPSYGGGSTGYGGYNRSSGGFGFGGLCIVAIIVLAVIIIAAKNKGNNAPMAYMAPPQPYYGGNPGGAYTPETFSLGALAIAFDSSARAQVQGEMDRIASSINMSGPDGLQQAANAVGEVITRHLDAAYLTHSALSENLTMQTTQGQFQQAVDAERGRFIVETVRGDAGGVRKINAPKSTGRAEEGGGFVVVTVLVARRGALAGFVPANSRQALAHDLQVLLGNRGPTGAMQAMEVVWQPSDPNDVMSSAEMATVFPTLKPIAPDARVGRRACAHCKNVYAAELPQCPSCGAPANS